jgi:O-antigen/teichoic acid export membrane protein
VRKVEVPLFTGAAGPREDSFAASVVLLFGLTAVQRLVGLARSVFCCRWLDAESLGEWDMAFSFLLLAAPLAMLGLPGSFGRYTEYFRSRGQLRTLLRRMTTFAVVAAILSVGVVWWRAEDVSRLVFGQAGLDSLVVLLAVCLGVVIAQNYISSLFASLRMYRIVSGQQLATTLLFAVFCIGLLIAWEASARSVIIAYAIACLTASAGALYWLRNVWRCEPLPEAAVAHRGFWGKLVPFAVWIWIANWLTNLFGMVDRYMIIHLGQFGDDAALAVVGEYHSSRIVPLLFIGVAELLATMILPYFSYDWERGQTDAVSRRLNLVLKSFGFALAAGGVLVLALAPLLFTVAFDGKFPGGESVFPLTMTYCAWMGLAIVAQMYLHCVEKARVVSIALACGLLVNVILNLLLLPPLGLTGAVLATTAGVLLVLLIVMSANLHLGLRFDAGTLVVAALPALFWFGPWATLAGVVVCGAAVVTTDRLLDRPEKELLVQTVIGYWHKARTMLRPGRPGRGYHVEA